MGLWDAIAKRGRKRDGSTLETTPAGSDVKMVEQAADGSGGDVVVDVREDLRAGREPFQKIMKAAAEVPVGGSLTLFATFKPIPLIAVLKAQGFEGEATQLGRGDWKVVFRRVSDGSERGGHRARGGAGGGARPGVAQAGSARAGTAQAGAGQAGTAEADGAAPPGAAVAGDGEMGEDGVIRLDNRGLEPPEPMVRTLEAITRLPPGGRIVGLFDRRPMFLLPKLEQMGFVYRTTPREDGSVEVVIDRPESTG